MPSQTQCFNCEKHHLKGEHRLVLLDWSSSPLLWTSSCLRSKCPVVGLVEVVLHRVPDPRIVFKGAHVVLARTALLSILHFWTFGDGSKNPQMKKKTVLFIVIFEVCVISSFPLLLIWQLRTQTAAAIPTLSLPMCVYFFVDMYFYIFVIIADVYLSPLSSLIIYLSRPLPYKFSQAYPGHVPSLTNTYILLKYQSESRHRQNSESEGYRQRDRAERGTGFITGRCLFVRLGGSWQLWGGRAQNQHSSHTIRQKK